ncbi:MAG: hypothetical protein R3E90_01005 [Marinicella sp.]|nr:hypothetical protein [Xanthomonadales bacterium]
MNVRFKCIFMWMLIFGFHVSAAPVGSQFTYQGSLTDNGSPANGEYDFQFELLNDSNANNPIQVLLFENIEVSRGLFAVELDYGAGPFSGDDYFIRVSVRPGDSLDTYTVLLPSQRINATPYAIQTEFLDDMGASSGQVLKFDGTDWAPANEASSLWSDRTNGIAYNNGNVLIGGSNNNQVSTDTSLFIESSAGDSPLRARVNGTTKFQIHSNGGANIGGGPLAPDNGLYVTGDTAVNADLDVSGLTNLDQTFVSAANGVNPLIVSINGQFALQVVANKGVSVGAANANVIPPPSGGLYVNGETELNQKTTITDDLEISGDAKHSNAANAYGFAKAGVSFSCGNAGSLVHDYFNNINDSPITVSNGNNFGACVINIPFSYQGLFFVTNAEYNQGAVPILANCNQGIVGGGTEVVSCRVRDMAADSNIVTASKVTLMMF